LPEMRGSPSIMSAMSEKCRHIDRTGVSARLLWPLVLPDRCAPISAVAACCFVIRVTLRNFTASMWLKGIVLVLLWSQDGHKAGLRGPGT
jgi:hypothetical protein